MRESERCANTLRPPNHHPAKDGTMAAKKCTKCGEEKPLDQFYKQKWCKFGVRPDCKACFYTATRERLLKDPQAAQAYRREYREKNREEIVARDKAYYEANKARLIAQSVEYNRRNKEAYLARLRKWRKENLGQVLVWTRNRRAKIKGLPGSHSLDDIKSLLVSQRGKCIYCRCDISKKFQVDHIVPVAKGGSNSKANLQLLCRTCNIKKRDKDPTVFAKERGFLL